MLRRIRESYSLRLIAAVTLLNLISILIVSILFYFTMYHTVNQDYRRVADNTATQIATEAESRMEDIKRIVNYFVLDRSFYVNIKREYEGIERQNILNDYLLAKGNTATVLSELPVSIKLYLKNETIPEHYYIDDEDSSRPGRNSFEVMHVSKIEDADYYREFCLMETNQLLKSVDTDREKGCISLLVKLNSFSPNSEGMLRVRVKFTDLFGDLLGEELEQKMNYKVFFAGDCVYNCGEKYREKKTDICVEKTLQQWNFKITTYMPVENIRAGARRAYFSLFLVAALCFLLTVAAAYLIRRHLYGDIKKILKGIDEFQLGNYEYNIETIGNDEFYQIAKSLNRFAHSTGHLINDVYEVMIQKQDVEVQMLHAKVNPHFLYNIFSIISQMATAGKNDEIVQIVDRTAKFYRCALSKKAEAGTIDSELDILKRYFEIIDIQRPGAVSVEYEIDDDVLLCEIPSFTLQPIVENSIKHAMIDGKIHIGIRASCDFQEGDVTIAIRDDGVGMTEEQVQELFLLRENRGYGLYNIRERFRLKYESAKYDIRCESEYGKGTVIFLTLPMKIHMEETDDV